MPCTITPRMIEIEPGHFVILDHGRPIGEVPLPKRPPEVGVGEKTVLLVIPRDTPRDAA